MQLGFVHFDREDQKKYLAVLNKLSDGGAVDELGIGRIRDYYSDRMFPGISSLHQHAKYFTVLPLLYRKASEYPFKNRSEVRKRIINLEIELTLSLKEQAEKEGLPIAGITGSTYVKRGSNKYVKYDPTYIYGSALVRYGILKHEDIDEIIFQQSRLLREKPEKYEGNEDEQGDADFAGRVDLICDYSPLDINLNWQKGCTLALTGNEADFLAEHILNSTGGSLLHHLITTGRHLPVRVENENRSFDFIDYVDVYSSTLPDNLRIDVERAKYFSLLVRGLYHRYNMLYSKGRDLSSEPRDAEDDFNKWYGTIFAQYADRMRESLRDVHVNDDGASVSFCNASLRHLENKDWTELDELIRSRELRIKGNRSKIGTEGYEGQIHNYLLSFRWETVRTLVNELLEGLER